MTEIILVRHGETNWNAAEIFRGRADVELNETGLKQAELLAGYLDNLKIEAILTSPLQRAVKTASSIARKDNLKVITAPGLIDFNYGNWQGLKKQEVMNRYEPLYSEWISHPEKVKMIDGESLEDVRERAMRVVAGVIEKYTEAIVLVAHRVVNKVLICALLGLDNSHFWDIRQDTCGITAFTYENGHFILTRHNDTSHLKSMPVPAPIDF